METHTYSTSTSCVDQSKFIRFAKGATIEAPHKLVHEAFSKTAAENPSTVAVEHDGDQITYGELDLASTKLSRKLLDLGLCPRDRVVLLVQRSIPMMVAIFAVLKSGCQYVPMDGGVASDDALAHVLSEAEPPFVLCLTRYSQRAHQFAIPGTQILSLEDSWTTLTDFDVEPGHKVVVDPDDGAYIIYTSGSTGKPKGVDVTHRNLTNLLTISPGNLGVDTIIATPTILGTLKEEDFPNIKTIALAGEHCSSRLADQWAHNRDFFNCCGPTEVTIVNTMHKHQQGQVLSVGRPVPNTTVYVLDKNEEPAPIGAVGIMWVGGSCVSRGYINLPGLTNARYKQDKFLTNGRMMFNTGDLCKWREDGTLELLGRVDDQVKIKGFRVELDGVSAVIESHPEVTKACALLVDGILCGFYVSPVPISHEALETGSSKTLPYYAIPSKWVRVPGIPLTPNGKTDKKMLKTLPAAPCSGDITPLTLPTSSSTFIPASQSSKEDIVEKSLARALVVNTTLPLPGSQESLSEKEFILPSEKGAHSYMWLRYYFFTMYRRLFSFVFIGNLATVLTIFAYRRTLDNLQLSDLATATASNITVALLMRQEYVINLLFTVACSVPTWMPLLIRRNCAKVFHIGGIHSSAGVAAVLWFFIFTVAATMGLAAPERTSLGKTNLAIVLIVYIILALLISILATAYPSFRAKWHDIFERIHRFAGWTILVLFWILTVLSADASRGYVPLSEAITRDPTLYLLIISTISVILPWLRLRKVRVRSEVLSSHAIRLHFSYTNTYSGTAIRISERPLIEWHAFATVAKPGVDGFSLVVSNAGNWTKRQIERAPERLWVRGIPACGVLRIVPLFKRIVLVATGSGIGPCLPVLLAKKVPMRVFWSTPNPEQTFGEEIIASVKGADPDAVIWNTRKQGKPDMVKEAWKLVAESGMASNGRYEVEAVCVIANKKVTEMVVRGMEVRGLAAFGAIFDS
ncbi:MAG: hypothetical protein Q9179_006971 [Wetmoreana sp. 5 TL-2023]